MQVLKNQEFTAIPNEKKVKITDMGFVKEIMYIEKLNVNGFPVKKLNKNEYMVLETGEVKEYQNHIENRSQDTESLRKTFKTLRGLITTNFQGNKNELAFTITYAENMKDVKQLYADFKKFMMKLKYKYPNIDYINVVEPQERGAWHCHVLIRFNGLEKVYVPNKDIAEMWGNGFVSIKAIRQNVDNLGAYLSAYLGDVELKNKNQIKPGQVIKEVEVEGKKKKFIKGGRLYLYPPGMNIYRCSRGIKQPKISYDTYANAIKDIKKIDGAVTPVYSTKTVIRDDDGKMLNSICYENYNLKRKKSEGNV